MNLKEIKKILFTKIVPIWGAFMTLISVSGCNNSSIEQENENLQSQIEMLEKENLALDEALKNTASVVDKLTQEAVELQERLEQLEEENEQLQTAVDRMKTPSPVDNNLDLKHSISLFFNGGKLEVDSISKAFQFKTEAKDMHYSAGYVVGYSYFPDLFGYTDMNVDGSYKIITKDGVKFLVDANDYTKVYLSGFDKLESPFYLKYHDPANGSLGSSGKYPGYVLPYYDALGRLYLADLNTFEILLYAVDPIDLSDCQYNSYSENYASRSSLRNWFERKVMHFPAYDAGYNGNDKAGEYSGMAFIFYKNGVPYCVDANDFSKVLAVQFDKITSTTDTIEISYADGRKDCYDADAFSPKTSNDLTANPNATRARLK